MTENGVTGDIVYAFIDGYNFYYSINYPDLLPLGWCNFTLLARRLAQRAFQLSEVACVKYYTASVDPKLRILEGEPDRQKMWLDALHLEAPEVRVIKGYFKKGSGKRREEKQTDVNLATDMVMDAATFDRAILVSDDHDFIPAIQKVCVALGREAAIFFPFGAKGYRLPYAATDWLTEEDLSESRMRDEILKPDGTVIRWEDYLRLKKGRYSSSRRG